MEFAILDQNTFGHSKFIIKDSTLFNANFPNANFNKKRLVLTLDSSSIQTGKGLNIAHPCEQDVEWCEWDDVLGEYVGTGIWATVYDPVCLAQIGSGGESGFVSGFGNGTSSSGSSGGGMWCAWSARAGERSRRAGDPSECAKG